MRFRNPRWLVVLGIAVAILVFLAFPSREQNVRATLARATEVLKAKQGEDAAERRGRLDRELLPLLSPNVRLEIPGVAAAPNRASVVERVAALTAGRAPVIQLEHIEIRFERSDHASAQFDAVVSDSQVGDLHGDARRVRAELEKHGSNWLITSVASSPEERAEPEARP
jgi:hypothetical protein